MLIYPNEDVKEYLALSWASECVSDQWLVFDKMFKARKEEISRMRRQGLKTVDVTAEKCYVETVEQMAKDKDPFASAIVNSCINYDETGFTKLGYKWEEYVEILAQKITEENSEGQDNLDLSRKKVMNALGNLQPEGNRNSKADMWKPYMESYTVLQVY